MKHLPAIVLALVVSFIAFGASASELDIREHIESVGVADVKLVPNEFVLTSTITSFDKTLDRASKHNDTAVAQAFRDLTKLGIKRRYVVTDQVSVTKVTEGYREHGNFRMLGYSVTRGVTVILHDPTKIEPAMKALFGVDGVDRLTMTTGHTDAADAAQSAQIKAAGDARDKAKRLAASLGRTLGPAVAISEEAAPRNDFQSFVYTAQTPDLGDALSLGKIRVGASVRVKFLLK